LPLITRIKNYSRADLRADLLAGATVSFVLIPQAVAYAMLAGVTPVMGLYAAFLPALVYALTGTSRHMAVGPVAIICLLIASGLAPLSTPGTIEYDQLATMLALIVAVMFLGLAIIRAGFLINFLSHPTIVGFNAAAGILTALSQVRGFFGIPRASVPEVGATKAWPVFAHLDETHLLTLVIAACSLGILLITAKRFPRVPGVLLVCVGGILLTWGAGLSAAGMEVVGQVPVGLPTFGLPFFEGSRVGDLMPAAASIVVVGYASSITVVKGLAAQDRDRIRPNRELWAFSAANAASAASGGFPVTAALARSSVMAEAGSRTQVAGMLAGFSVLAVLVFLAPVFEFLPLAVLAAIVIKAALSLIDVRSARAIFKTKRSDMLTLVLTLGVTLFVSLETGLLVGIVLALLSFVYRMTRPHSAELGRLRESNVYRNVDRYDVEICPQVGILRVDAPLYYANARFLEDKINAMFADRPAMKILMLDAAAVSDIDATAVQSLGRLLTSLRKSGNDIHFVQLIGPVRDLMQRSGLMEAIGEESTSRTILEAAPKVMAQIRRDYCETKCRARAFPPCERIPRRGDTSTASEAARFSPQI
jgi:SulP family sulfate permease